MFTYCFIAMELFLLALVTMASAARPQLRGLLKGQLVRHVATVTILSVITVGLTKHFLKDARLKAYEEFYK